MKRTTSYNTERENLRLPEYGRCVHEMVKYALTIEDREMRQHCAESIVEIMAGINAEQQNEESNRQEIWDHLALISDYKLDVDYPFEVTRLDGDSTRPEPLRYPNNKIRQRQYGLLLEKSLAELANMPEGEEREQMKQIIADQMKQSLFTWNRDAMDNEKVAHDMAEYTDGRVILDLEKTHFAAVQTLPRQDGGGKRKKKR